MNELKKRMDELEARIAALEADIQQDAAHPTHCLCDKCCKNLPMADLDERISRSLEYIRR